MKRYPTKQDLYPSFCLIYDLGEEYLSCFDDQERMTRLYKAFLIGQRALQKQRSK